MTFKEELKVFWSNAKMVCSEKWIAGKIQEISDKLEPQRKCGRCNIKPPTNTPKPDITPPTQVAKGKEE